MWNKFKIKFSKLFQRQTDKEKQSTEEHQATTLQDQYKTDERLNKISREPTSIQGERSFRFPLIPDEQIEPSYEKKQSQISSHPQTKRKSKGANIQSTKQSSRKKQPQKRFTPTRVPSPIYGYNDRRDTEKIEQVPTFMRQQQTTKAKLNKAQVTKKETETKQDKIETISKATAEHVKSVKQHDVETEQGNSTIVNHKSTDQQKDQLQQIPNNQASKQMVAATKQPAKATHKQTKLIKQTRENKVTNEPAKRMTSKQHFSTATSEKQQRTSTKQTYKNRSERRREQRRKQRQKTRQQVNSPNNQVDKFKQEQRAAKQASTLPFNVMMPKGHTEQNRSTSFEQHGKKRAQTHQSSAKLSSQNEIQKHGQQQKLSQDQSQNKTTVSLQANDKSETVKAPQRMTNKGAETYSIPYHLLNDPPKKSKDDEQWVKEQIAVLERTLQHFNVDAKVVHASQGPTVTRFEVKPAIGVKVSRIRNLNDDLKLNKIGRAHV